MRTEAEISSVPPGTQAYDYLRVVSFTSTLQIHTAPPTVHVIHTAPPTVHVIHTAPPTVLVVIKVTIYTLWINTLMEMAGGKVMHFPFPYYWGK